VFVENLASSANTGHAEKQKNGKWNRNNSKSRSSL